MNNIKHFKKGMKVKISNNVSKTENTWKVVIGMYQMIGKPAIIDRIDYCNKAVVIRGYSWHPDDILLLSDNKISKVDDVRSFTFNTDLLVNEEFI